MAYIGKQPVVGNFVKLDAITTSATATYNLLNGGVAYSPQSANNCIVSLNGIIQEPTSSGNVGGYTISGSTIVFTSALTSLDVIDFILVLGDTLSIGTPSDGTVTFPKVTSNLITGATAESTIAGGDSILIYDDSASALRKMTRTNFVAGIGGIFESRLFHVRDEKPNNTSGGTFTSGSFQTRTLNTVMTNEITGASLASNQITLPSGTYYIFASANVGTNVQRHTAKLRNTTDSSDTIIGSSEFTSGDSTKSFVIGRFTIASQKVFELQHICSTTGTTDGFGTNANFSIIQVFADVQIWKVA
jgi:hypothetical protein